jgi:hypothetical protein
MATAEEEYNNIVASGQRPIPGQSFSNDPNNPWPWERPPEYTSVHAASEYMFGKFIEPDTYVSLMTAISKGTPIMDIVQTLLFIEFKNGKFNPDLMIMMVEPTIYMLIALAENLDLDMVVYRGEEEDQNEEEQILGVSFSEERLKKLQKAGQTGIVPKGAIRPEMQQQIEELPTIPELENKQESLMSRPEGI